MRSCTWGMVVALLIMGGAGTASLRAQESILFANGIKQPVSVWFWPRGAANWSNPVQLPRDGFVSVLLKSPGEYYLAVRDLSNNTDHLRWYDLHRLAREAPGVVLTVAGGYVQETRQVTRTVSEQVPVTKTGTRSVVRLVAVTGPDGVTRYQQVVVQEPYEYVEYQTVNRQVTEEVTVNVFKAELKATHDGKAVTLSDYAVADQPKK